MYILINFKSSEIYIDIFMSLKYQRCFQENDWSSLCSYRNIYIRVLRTTRLCTSHVQDMNIIASAIDLA